MIRSISIVVVLLSLATFSFGQQPVHQCGTQPYKSEFLKKYQANPEAYATRAGDLLMVPLTIHNVGNDSGFGHYNFNKLLEAMCALNADFEGTDIQFYLEGDVIYYDNSAYNAHTTFVEGANMMFENNIENTINNYIVSNPSGAAGYNLPYAGIAMGKAYMSPGNHTWAHEIGHNLSLPHPFIGWEGGVSHDGSVSHSYDQPAPEFVTYNYTVFQSEFFNDADTLIIDTAFVEYVDGSNCTFAADGFCDTSPNYLDFTFDCDGTIFTNPTQTDPTGATFQSDATLFMAYSLDECANRFSPDQIAAMRATLINEKPELLYDLNPPALVDASPIQTMPLQDEVVPYDEVTFTWEAVPNATTYFVEVSRLSDFSLIAHEELTSNTYTTAFDLQVEKDYYWRVRAFNKKSFCAPASDNIKFETGDFVSNENITLSNFSIYPTILNSGTDLTIDWNDQSIQHLSIQIFNSAGALIQKEDRKDMVGQNTYEFNTTILTQGVYFIAIQADGKTERAKFVIN